YTVTLALASSDMEAAGFEAAFRFAEGTPRAGEGAGTVEPIDGRVGVSAAGTVAYVHHTGAGSTPDRPTHAAWTFVWTAPDEPLPVVLHAAANSANGDDSPLGDLIYSLERPLAVSGPESRR
ncbi:MAG: hypothetical protein D6701_14675, partial [Gemmatimonadetes bacterium]